MGAYKHSASGVKVTVSDDKELGPDWVPADDEGAKRTTRKKAGEKPEQS